MEIFVRDDNGKEVKIKELENLGQGNTLLIQLLMPCTKEIREQFENELSVKTGKMIVLIPSFAKAIGAI